MKTVRFVGTSARKGLSVGVVGCITAAVCLLGLALPTAHAQTAPGTMRENDASAPGG